MPIASPVLVVPFAARTLSAWIVSPREQHTTTASERLTRPHYRKNRQCAPDSNDQKSVFDIAVSDDHEANIAYHLGNCH